VIDSRRSFTSYVGPNDLRVCEVFQILVGPAFSIGLAGRGGGSFWKFVITIKII